MSDPIGRWLCTELLLMLAAFFCTLLAVAFEEASEARLREEAEEGNRRAARALPLVEEPEQLAAAARIGARCAGFFAVYNEMTRTLFTRLAGTGRGSAVALVLLWLCAVLLAHSVDQLAARRYARCRAEKLVCRYVGLAQLVGAVCAPALTVCRGVSTALVRLLGLRPSDENAEVGEDEILELVDAGEESGGIEAAEKELIENVFAFDSTSAEDIMVHRTDMVIIWTDDTDEQILQTIEESGLSRFPVCGEDADDVIGILSTRDFLLERQSARPRPLRELLRSAYFVPESVKTDVLFRDMQKQKVHVAIVVDEYGGTSGLVTMEDLLEQLVGDIYDEFDAEEEQEIVRQSEDTWRVAGFVAMEDLAETLDLTLDEEDEGAYETLGGLIFSKLSVIPEDGTHPEIEALGLHIRADEIRDRRVEWATVRRLPPPPEEEKE